MYSSMKTPSNTDMIRSSIVSRTHTPSSVPTTPVAIIGTRYLRISVAADRFSIINQPFARAAGIAITATAYSTPMNVARTGIASGGPPRPVTPLAKKPNATAASTRRISPVSI